MRRLSRRWIGLIVAGPCLAVIAVAWTLQPRSSGYGTHTQLGLPGCGILAKTGWPCPSCGLTTSVSASVHGQFAAAFRAQPFGLVLFMVLAAAVVVGLAQAITGKAIFPRPRLWWAIAGMGGMLAGWLWKLVAGVISGGLPLHG